MLGVPGLSSKFILLQYLCHDFIFAMKPSHVCNFADDNTEYACDKDIELVATRLDDIYGALRWLNDNKMVANPRKFKYIMVLGLKQHQELFWDKC